MDNQEAIMRIKEHIRIHQICEPRAIKISEALDMAISALEAQTDGDCISRQAAIDELRKYCKEYRIYELYESGPAILRMYLIRAGDAMDTIENLPSAQPERKPGHWIQVGCNQECSECGATYADLYPDYDETNYCPNCGADMRGDQG